MPIPINSSCCAFYFFFLSSFQITCVVDMEPWRFGSDDTVPFWPPSNDEEEADLLSTEASVYTPAVFTRAPEVGRVVDSEGETVVPRDIGTWFQLAELQLAQVGRLALLPPPPRRQTSPNRRGAQRRHSQSAGAGQLFRRRVIVRRLLPPQHHHQSHSLATPRRATFHTVEILHFKAQWRIKNQVCSVLFPNMTNPDCPQLLLVSPQSTLTNRNNPQFPLASPA